MNLSKTLLAASLSLVLTAAAHAEFKVAVVDIARVLNDCDQAKENRQALDSKSQGVKKKLEDKRAQLRSFEQNIREKEAAQNSKEVDQLRSQARDFERMVHDAEDELRKEYMKANRGLSEKALKIINAYAKENDFDIVLDKGDKIRGPVLYGNSSLDITDDILEQMND